MLNYMTHKTMYTALHAKLCVSVKIDNRQIHVVLSNSLFMAMLTIKRNNYIKYSVRAGI